MALRSRARSVMHWQEEQKPEKKTHNEHRSKWKVRIADTKWVKTTSQTEKEKYTTKTNKRKITLFPTSSLDIVTPSISLCLSPVGFVCLLRQCFTSFFGPRADCWKLLWTLPMSSNKQWVKERKGSPSTKENRSICWIESTTHLDSIEIASLFVSRGWFSTRSIHPFICFVGSPAL